MGKREKANDRMTTDIDIARFPQQVQQAEAHCISKMDLLNNEPHLYLVKIFQVASRST